MSYATLNTRFDLPPPPPKSVFSTVRNEAGRAWFPDFSAEQDPVGSLKQFVKILFYPSLDNSTFVQLKVLSVLTAIIGICILLIILRRLYEKSFWLFRLVRRSNGTLLVPNAITAFVAIESTFAILLIALCWRVTAWYQHGGSPKYVILWIGLTWVPMMLGAWCTTVGIIYARPDALSFVSPQPGKPPSWAMRMGITPMFVNAFVFCIPAIQIVSVVVPAVLAQQRFSAAFEHYVGWSASVRPTQGLSRDLLLEAQQIWFQVLDAAYYLSICMVVWEAWVCGLFICYCLAGGSLIGTLRKQLETLKSFKQNRSFSESFAVPNGKVPHRRRPSDAVPTSAGVQNDVDVEKQTTGSAASRLLSVQAPLRSLSVSSAFSDNITLVSGDEGRKRAGSKSDTGAVKGLEADRSDGSKAENGADRDGQTRSIFFTSEELQNMDEPTHSFFPAVRPSAFERPTNALSTTVTCKDPAQKRYLEKFYLNFVIQFVGLMLCILFFAVFCGKLVTTWYSAWEANDFAPALQIALLVVCWVTVALASIIIFAILSRTYEPVLASIGATTQQHGRSNSREGASVSSDPNGATRPRRAARRLSGAKAWVVTSLSQLSNEQDRRGQQIGMEHVSSSHHHGRRAGSLSGGGRPSVRSYAELDDAQACPSVEQGGSSSESQRLTLRKATSSCTPDLLQASTTEAHMQRSWGGATSNAVGSRVGKNGVMIEQTVSTIVEDPTVEDFFEVERPARPAAALVSPSKSDLSEQDISTPYSLDGFLETPSRSGDQWADSPGTPGTLWTPCTPASTKYLVPKRQSKQGSDEWLSHRPDGVTTVVDDHEFVFRRPTSDASLRPAPRPRRVKSNSDNSIGLGIAMTSSSSPPRPAWTAPTDWGSGQPDPVLMQEDASMRLRMASKPHSDVKDC